LTVALLERFLVSVGDKLFVMGLIAFHWFLLILDAAPVELGARSNLACIPEQSVRVATVDTVYFVDIRNVLESPATQRNVVATLHQRDAVEPKTNGVVDFERHIKKDDRDEHSIDEWDGKKVFPVAPWLLAVFHPCRSGNALYKLYERYLRISWKSVMLCVVFSWSAGWAL
jgi:hypothetical protein